MIDVFSWPPSDGWQRFLFDAAWQSTLVTAAAALCLCRVRQPALQGWVALLGISLSIALPVGAWCARFMGVGLIASEIASGAPSHTIAPAAPSVTSTTSPDLPEPVGIPTNSKPEDALRTEIDRADSQFPFWQLTGVVLACGTAVLLARILLAALAVRRLLADSQPCAQAELIRAATDAAAQLDVTPPRVLCSTRVASPTMVAFRRPTLLVPASLIQQPSEQSSTDRWRAICCHELAHVRRRDGWAKLLIELCTAALPWQPGIWWLRRKFHAAAEEACDAWTISLGVHPVALADLLTEFIPLVPRYGLGVAMNTSDTRLRILRLLSLKEPLAPSTTRRKRWACAVAAALLFVPLALAQRVAANPDEQADAPRDPDGATKPIVSVPETDASPSGDVAPTPTATKWRKPEYIIESPDILLIDSVKLVSKAPYRIEALDVLFVQGTNLLPEAPLAGDFAVEPGGRVNLGATYGSLKLEGLTLEEAQDAIKKHLMRVVRTPEVSVNLAQTSGIQQISGEHLVGPDGTVNLGTYGSVPVHGLTIREAREAIEKHLLEFAEKATVAVDVYKYNSKVYYVVIEDEIEGDSIVRLPITGNETVMDAIAVVSEEQGIRIGADTKIVVARPSREPGKPVEMLPFNWREIIRGGDTSTNYQLMPGDRVTISMPKRAAGDNKTQSTPRMD